MKVWWVLGGRVKSGWKPLLWVPGPGGVLTLLGGQKVMVAVLSRGEEGSVAGGQQHQGVNSRVLERSWGGCGEQRERSFRKAHGC